MKDVTDERIEALLLSSRAETDMDTHELCQIALGGKATSRGRAPTPFQARSKIAGLIAKQSGEEIDFRGMLAGTKFDNIPLISCPVCGQTGFTLGPTYPEMVEESFAHVVEGLTKRKGTVVVECSRPWCSNAEHHG